MQIPKNKTWLAKATAKGFEPSRAEPNGFLVHLLNHSDTLSLQGEQEQKAIDEKKIVQRCDVIFCGAILFKKLIIEICRANVKKIMNFGHQLMKRTSYDASHKTPTVGLEPTTTRLRALRSTDWARRAWLCMQFCKIVICLCISMRLSVHMMMNKFRHRDSNPGRSGESRVS